MRIFHVTVRFNASASQLRARMEDDVPAINVRDKMIAQLPESWTECSWEYEQLAEKAASESRTPVSQQGQVDFEGLWFFGAKDNSVYCGMECSGVGNVRLCAPWQHGMC